MKELLSDEFIHKLEHLAQEKAEEYKNNKPFPHIYFDNFLPVGSRGSCTEGIS